MQAALRTALLGAKGGPVLDPAITNLKASNTAVIRTALRAVRAGIGRARILFVGDSTTQGGSFAGNSRYYSHPSAAARRLAALGYPVTAQNAFGWGNLTTAAQYNGYNNAVVLNGTWGQASAGLGGPGLTSGSSGDTLVFSPPEPVRFFRMRHAKLTTLGSFTWKIDGGAESAPVSQTTASGADYVELIMDAGSVGLHVLTLKVASGAARFSDIEAYLATPQVEILNVGWAGATTANWNVATNPWSPRPAVTAAAAHLVMINLGINNWRTEDVTAQFSADIQALIDAARAGGADVVLISPFPSATSGAAGNFATEARQLAYRNAVAALAASNDLPVIDLKLKFTDWDAANANGFAYDTLHPSVAGYDVVGRMVGDMLDVIRRLG